MGKLDDKVAIVTGSTSGIGEAIAKMFASEGAKVVVSGRDAERGKNIVDEIIRCGGVASFLPCDTTKEDDIIKLIKSTIQLFGKLDILVNNAGLFFTGPLEKLESDSWDAMFDLNVKGYFLMSKYAMPYLVQSGSGVILNNASVAGMQSYASGSSYAYSASKAAVVQLSRILALNYGKEGVRVNTICPGIIQTPIFQGRDVSSSSAKIPLGRVGKPEDVARVATFLVSGEAEYVTGIVLPIDGGLSI
ncbi:SDR family NAD(P)-dependent oxidoreductase [Clostridium tagluense]|uniref:SDR family NAD(P)-dependent oxidoreductase n=1 Tax=Clostridium tagluense TaxID=360422 RepID=UPI001CF28D21|nr:SDR family oxidoreductase [Clostridium tagluense]MCB2296794.1 SDR family oxidoreductase [Clostridium tagluense]